MRGPVSLQVLKGNYFSQVSEESGLKSFSKKYSKMHLIPLKNTIHIGTVQKLRLGGLVISWEGVRDLNKNSGVGYEILGGGSQISYDIRHPVIYTKVHKASKQSYNTIISILGSVHL